MADNAFELLGLPETATCAQVRRAYLSKAQQLHPDKVAGDTEEFVRMHEAYRFALQACARPLTCVRCSGLGFTERVSGWRVAQTICADCGGAGTVPRGGGV